MNTALKTFEGGVALPPPTTLPDGAVAETSDDSDEGEDESRKRNEGFDRIDENAGPGMPLTTFLPKEDTLVAKMRPSLTPSEE